MDGAGLGRTIERAQGVLESLDRIAGLATRGDLDGLRDKGLGGAAARLIDLGTALGRADALERGGSSCAGPASGLPGQVQTSGCKRQVAGRAEHDPTGEGEWYQKPRRGARSPVPWRDRRSRRALGLGSADRAMDHPTLQTARFVPSDPGESAR